MIALPTLPTRLGLLVALFGAVACNGCNNRQAFHEPDPTLARMLEQRRASPYSASAVFADGKSMRDPPRGAVARDEDVARPAVTRELLTRGRVSFERVCATCHGIAGNGESVVAAKMTRRPPPSLLDGERRAYSQERLFMIATQGYGLMPSLSEVLGSDDRWAVAAYVKALQLSQSAPVAELPPALRAELAKEAP